MVLHIQFSNSYVWKKCILEIFCVAIPIFQYVSLSLPKFSRIPYYFRCCCCPASVAGLCLDCSNFGYGQWWQVIDKNRVDHPLDSPFSETALFVSLPKDINGEKSIRLPFWGVILNGGMGGENGNLSANRTSVCHMNKVGGTDWVTWSHLCHTCALFLNQVWP